MNERGYQSKKNAKVRKKGTSFFLLLFLLLSFNLGILYSRAPLKIQPTDNHFHFELTCPRSCRIPADYTDYNNKICTRTGIDNNLQVTGSECLHMPAFLPPFYYNNVFVLAFAKRRLRYAS